MGKDFNPGRGGRGGGGRGGRGGGRGGFSGGGRGGFQNYGPPSSLIEIGVYSHPCKEQIVCKTIQKQQVPKFNRRIFLQNKNEVGTVDEIMGPVDSYLFSVNLKEGVSSTSFEEEQKFYIDPMDCLPLERFLPRPKGAPSQGGGRGRGGGRGGFGGRGGGFGGRGGGFGGRGGGFGGRGGGGRGGFGGRGGGGFGGRGGGGRGGFGGRGGRGRGG